MDFGDKQTFQVPQLGPETLSVPSGSPSPIRQMFALRLSRGH